MVLLLLLMVWVLMSKNAKKIAKVLVEKFQELVRNGDLTRDGKKVATAINNLRKERRLTSKELDRSATI
jgi:hypothetical protein